MIWSYQKTLSAGHSAEVKSGITKNGAGETCPSNVTSMHAEVTPSGTPATGWASATTTGFDSGHNWSNTAINPGPETAANPGFTPASPVTGSFVANGGTIILDVAVIGTP